MFLLSSLPILLCVLSILFSWQTICVTAQSERIPTISYITQSPIKDIGDTVEFQCSVLYTKYYSVIWKKLGSDPADPVFLSTDDSILTKDSRFSIQYNRDTLTYTLQIKDIKETDAGSYQCQIRVTPNDSITTQVTLFVRRPPVLLYNSTEFLVKSEFSSAQIECYADGYPTPTITWGRENNTILPDGNVTYIGNILKIDSVKREDHGYYYCIADNGIGKSYRHDIKLEIEFAPVIFVEKACSNQALQYINLECHIEGLPPPIIVWLKDNVGLSNNQHYNISIIDTDNGAKDSTLRITTTEEKQYGYYTCQAINKLGENTATIHLFETVPACPPAYVKQFIDNQVQSQVEKDGFHVLIDVQQFRSNEISVKTVDNTVIVEGKHEERQDKNALVSREFRHKYQLPNAYDIKNVISTLSTDGVLTIKAPPPQQSAGNERIIYQKYLNIKNYLSGDAVGETF